MSKDIHIWPSWESPVPFILVHVHILHVLCISNKNNHTNDRSDVKCEMYQYTDQWRPASQSNFFPFPCSFSQKLCQTRKHSSRLCTARLLTVSCCIGSGYKPTPEHTHPPLEIPTLNTSEILTLWKGWDKRYPPTPMVRHL